VGVHSERTFVFEIANRKAEKKCLFIQTEMSRRHVEPSAGTSSMDNCTSDAIVHQPVDPPLRRKGQMGNSAAPGAEYIRADPEVVRPTAETLTHPLLWS
jgi:hypothetical protein